jgi:glycosyltransferase involved in cell wall biosynthesis
VDRPARILLARGYQATPWELRPWELLPDRFEVGYLRLERNWFDDSELRLRRFPVRALSRFLPRGRVGMLMAAGLTGDRYLDADEAFAWADVVHASELSYWFAADAARRKPQNHYKLALTVWETIPLLDAYRNRYARAYRAETLAATDLFLPTTERARNALLLEGVERERTEVVYPGIDVDRFASAPAPDRPSEHVVVSPGRMVWEKGHQDVMRALAAVRRNLIEVPTAPKWRLVITGAGPEDERLRRYARELGIADAVEFRAVSYGEMPGVFARASCMVLASLPMASGAYVPGGIPHVFWEEQFGMVLAEAMAVGLPIVAAQSGAIPEVVDGAAELFLPGDWMGLARLLVEGPLSRPTGARNEPPPELVQRYSIEAASERLAAAYDRLLASS